MLAADANLGTRDSAKIASGLGEQERADRASLEATRTANAMGGNRLAERSPGAVGQQGDADRAEVQSMKAAAANPATRTSAKTGTGKFVQDLAVRDAEKAGGDKAASAANSGKDAGTTAAAASGIDPRFAITTFTGKGGQEYIQLPDIRSPGKPGERMQNAETERHAITPLNRTPDDQKEHWYEKVSDYFHRVGEEIKHDVKRGYQTAQEGLANFENTVKDSAWTFVGGSQLKDQVNSAVATVTNEVKQNADAIGSMVTSPSNQEAIAALGRQARQQLPAQQGAAPSGNAAFILSDSINGQVALSGTVPFGSLPVKVGGKATVELASGTVGQGGSYLSKDGQYKLGLTVGLGIPGSPLEVEASVGLTAKAGQIGARIDSVSVEPIVKLDVGQFYRAIKGGYDFVAGLATPGPTNALAGGTALQQLGQDFGHVLQGFQVGGQSLIPSVKASEAMGGATIGPTTYQPTLPTIPEGTSKPLPAYQGTIDDFRFSIKGTVMNTDAGTDTFRTGWKGDVAGGIEVQQQHYTIGKLRYGTSLLNAQFELQNVARAGFAFGTPNFVENAGKLVLT
jgi:hypothetical protein